jgi:anti-sigma B factor antagonist
MTEDSVAGQPNDDDDHDELSDTDPSPLVDELSDRPVLVISTRVDDAGLVIVLGGELDMNEAQRLSDEVQEALSSGVMVVGLDLGDLTFIDSGGLQAVLAAKEEVERRGAVFRLESMSPAVARVVQMTGVEQHLPPEDIEA